MTQVIVQRSDELMHFGIKGQKWGVRRYENEDGTLTDAGKERYRKDAEKARKEIGDASRDPMTSVGILESRSMQNNWFSGGKYRKLGHVIERNIRKEGRVYDKAVSLAEKMKKESKKEGLLLKGVRLKLSDITKAGRNEAGKNFADAVASISTQYISENFQPKEQARAKAWVYAAFIQGQDKQIKQNFD